MLENLVDQLNYKKKIAHASLQSVSIMHKRPILTLLVVSSMQKKFCLYSRNGEVHSSKPILRIQERKELPFFVVQAQLLHLGQTFIASPLH